MSKKYVCPWCGVASTEEDWDAASISAVGPDGDSLPDTWFMSTSEDADTVRCPECGYDFLRSEVSEPTGFVRMVAGDKMELAVHMALVPTEGTPLEACVVLDSHAAISKYLEGKTLKMVGLGMEGILFKIE